MNTTRTIVVLSRCADGLVANLEAPGLTVKVVDEIVHWDVFGQPVQAISFVFDGLSLPEDDVERLLIAWHLQSPKPDVVLIVAPTDPRGLRKRYAEYHMMVHCHNLDDWAISRDHLAGQRLLSHVNAA